MQKSHIARPALFLLLIAASASLVTYSQAPSSGKTSSESLTVPGEKHLGNVRQLTFGGTNAEAYFSADDKSLIFMHSGAGVPCDQMYTMPVDTPDGKARRAETREHGQRTHDVRLLFPEGRPHSVFLDARKPAPNARRGPIIRTVTSGRFTTPTKFTPPSQTAATCAL